MMWTQTSRKFPFLWCQTLLFLACCLLAEGCWRSHGRHRSEEVEATCWATEGAVLSSETINLEVVTVESDETPGTRSRATWTGSRYAVAWQLRDYTSPDIVWEPPRLRQYSLDGDPVAEGTPIEFIYGDYIGPIAYGHERWGMVRNDWRSDLGSGSFLFLNTFDDHGEPTSGDILVDADVNTGNMKITATSEGFAIVWLMDPPAEIRNIRLAIVDPDGVMLGDIIPVTDGISEPDQPQWPEDLLWTGSELLLSWWEQSTEDERIIHVTRRTAEGHLIRTFDVTGPPEWGQGHSISWTGSEIAVVWARELIGTNSFDIVLERHDPEGDLVDEAVVLRNMSNDGGAFINALWAADGHAVVWVVFNTLWFQFFSAEGEPMSEPVRIWQAPSGEHRTGGTEYLWTGEEFGLIFSSTHADEEIARVQLVRVRCE